MAEPRQVRGQPGWREVLIVAGVAVAVVLGAAGPHEHPAGEPSGGRLPHAAGDRRAHRRHRLAAVADLAPAARFGRRIDRTLGDAAPAHAPARTPRERPGRPDRRDVGRRHRRRRHRRRRRPARRGLARDARRAHRAGRHRGRHVVALVAAHPRRAALPRAVPLRARPRGARRALAAADARPAPRQDRAAALPDLRHPVRLEGVLRRGADAVRRPRGAARRRLAPAAVAGRHARPRTDPPSATACAAASSTTTASRTTRATRWPWLARRSPPAAWRSPGSGPRDLYAADDGRRHRRGQGRGHLTGGSDFEIPTRAVVDATGVWAAEPDHPFKGGSLRILPSRGAHLVVPRDRIPNKTGLTIRVPGKIVFLVPWPDHWLIGTTDAPYRGAAPTIRPRRAGRWTGCSTRSTRRWTST